MCVVEVVVVELLVVADIAGNGITKELHDEVVDEDFVIRQDEVIFDVDVVMHDDADKLVVAE